MNDKLAKAVEFMLPVCAGLGLLTSVLCLVGLDCNGFAYMTIFSWCAYFLGGIALIVMDHFRWQ